ncbi:hypothetical protein BAUCODRAFT_30092 [Baudoinia panamericana UAMH 10762]|uniref:Uncharacterized protein n=1 Tax=Baudoinia panamericana (strain UAMH 10762) TaxID=717646 RepID=M2N6K4_BAUPA|nr:uncharacterized protein BAUCODRAFT_30092 [Baudoinia panamericana UAMH 10762]EMC99713.1 hypothetical protein BAUCODRAFT_30092 [Baudoinia panamericana UAMH 10762]
MPARSTRVIEIGPLNANPDDCFLTIANYYIGSPSTFIELSSTVDDRSYIRSMRHHTSHMNTPALHAYEKGVTLYGIRQ